MIIIYLERKVKTESLLTNPFKIARGNLKYLKKNKGILWKANENNRFYFENPPYKIMIFCEISVSNIEQFMKILLVFLNCGIIKSLFPQTLNAPVV